MWMKENGKKKDKSYALKEKIFNDVVEEFFILFDIIFEEYNKKFLIDWEREYK